MYYKGDRSLLQYVLGIIKCDRLLLQSASGITKCDRLLLQSASGITKFSSYYNVRRKRLSQTQPRLKKYTLTNFDRKVH